ncbi:ATP-binding protein [Sphingopyxis sp.]|uniref:ATP-binding protein n=1 Tax=Sphingopyxis sp. TaxID=1908224 RepID=UPI002613B797|nr:ATP-binding protein [Sphingopyxis sp.]MCW0198123.1 ATP-binding protein [Sphingopyxis sp.]
MATEFTCTLSDSRAGLQAMMDSAEAFLADNAIPDRTAARILIALDEIVSNIFVHGIREGEPTVAVGLRVAEGRIAGEIVDDGIAFDPLSAAPPDTGLSLEDRPIGGLGLHIVRETMDEIRYDRDHGRNRLRFHKMFALKDSD